MQNEQKTVAVVDVAAKPETKMEAVTPSSKARSPAATSCLKSDGLMWQNLDEVIKYINGDEEEKRAAKQSAKAAKRARQKQRKVRASVFDFEIIGLK